MFSLDNIVLPYQFAYKLSFLSDYGVIFAKWGIDINGTTWTIVWLIVTFIVILFFKNTTERLKSFEINNKILIFLGFIIFSCLISLGAESEFLYFNF